MRSRLVGRLLRLVSRRSKTLRPAADRVLNVDALYDALKLCRAVLSACGARLRQKLSDGRAMVGGLGLKADHRVRVLGEFLQQLVFHLFVAHVPIVVRTEPLFKIARQVAMRNTLPDHGLNRESSRELARDVNHD